MLGVQNSGGDVPHQDIAISREIIRTSKNEFCNIFHIGCPKSKEKSKFELLGFDAIQSVPHRQNFVAMPLMTSEVTCVTQGSLDRTRSSLTDTRGLLTDTGEPLTAHDDLCLTQEVL